MKTLHLFCGLTFILSLLSPLFCEHLRPTASCITFPSPIEAQKKEDAIYMVATKNNFYMI